MELGEQEKKFEFVVPGQPATKGSTFSFLAGRRVITKPDCAHLDRWSRLVGVLAKVANVPIFPKGTAVYVAAFYEFERPTRTDRPLPSVRPDLDKLARALLDALTGIAYEDDGQVVGLHVRKTYGPETLTRVVITTELPAALLSGGW